MARNSSSNCRAKGLQTIPEIDLPGVADACGIAPQIRISSFRQRGVESDLHRFDQRSGRDRRHKPPAPAPPLIIARRLLRQGPHDGQTAMSGNLKLATFPDRGHPCLFAGDFAADIRTAANGDIERDIIEGKLADSACQGQARIGDIAFRVEHVKNGAGAALVALASQ